MRNQTMFLSHIRIGYRKNYQSNTRENIEL